MIKKSDDNNERAPAVRFDILGKTFRLLTYVKSSTCLNGSSLGAALCLLISYSKAEV